MDAPVLCPPGEISDCTGVCGPEGCGWETALCGDGSGECIMIVRHLTVMEVIIGTLDENV